MLNKALLEACLRNSKFGASKYISLGANVNQVDDSENSLLKKVILKGHAKIVKLLLDKSADVNQADINGYTPLYIAVIKNNTEIVKILLDNRADVNKANNRGYTPLFKAVENNNTEIVKILLEKDANVNHANNHGNTPLIMAVIILDTKIVKILLEKGADVNQVNNNNDTPLIIAVDNIMIEHLFVQEKIDAIHDIIKMLLEKNPVEKLEKLDELIKHVINILFEVHNLQADEEDPYTQKMIEIVKLLLKSNPNILNILDDKYCELILIVALKNPKGNEKLIEMLLTKKVKIDNNNDKKLLIAFLQKFIIKQEKIILYYSKNFTEKKKKLSIQSPSLYTSKIDGSLKIRTTSKLPSLPLDIVKIIYRYLSDHIYVVENDDGNFVISYNEEGEQGNKEKYKVLEYLQISNGGTRKKRKAFPRKTLSKKTRGKGKTRRTSPLDERHRRSRSLKVRLRRCTSYLS